MHQGLTSRVLIVSLGLFLIAPAFAQLNSSDEIIETIEDIKVEDDSDKKVEENPSKPKFDEEFSKEKVEEVAEPEIEEPEETRAVEKKAVEQKKQESYEDELEKNADQNKLDRKEIFPEDMKNFDVDPIQESPTKQAEPEKPKAPIVKESPKEEPPALEDEIQEEISELPDEQGPEEEQTPVVEEQGAPIQYAPEPTGPVLVYENEKTLTKEQRKDLSERTKVEIEDDPFVEGTLSEKVGDYLKPFKERRPRWTRQIEIGAAQYIPINYISDIIDSAGSIYEDYYDTEMPMPSFSFEFKRNFSFGGISLGGAISYYATNGAGGIATSSDFELIAPSLKLSLYLDTLFKEPYLVPYASVGYSYMMYNETATDGSDLEYSGASDNIFVAFGILFQLDWLDKEADQSSFDLGIENTFIFLEARSYLDTGIIGYDEDPAAGVIADFSSPFFLSGGIKMEF